MLLKIRLKEEDIPKRRCGITVAAQHRKAGRMIQGQKRESNKLSKLILDETDDDVYDNLDDACPWWDAGFDSFEEWDEWLKSKEDK